MSEPNEVSLNAKISKSASAFIDSYRSKTPGIKTKKQVVYAGLQALGWNMKVEDM